MKYRKLWEILMRRSRELAEGNERWIGQRMMEEMDDAEHEYYEAIIMKDLADGIDRMKTQEEEKE